MKIGNSDIGGVYLGADEVSKICLGSDEIWSALPPAPPDYLCFTALENGEFTFTFDSSLTVSDYPYIKYSTDDGSTWTQVSNVADEVVTATVAVSEGDKVLWKGNSSSRKTASDRTSNKQGHFSSTCNYTISGNVLSLIFEDDFSGKESQSVYFFGLFKNNTKLISVAENLLPSTSLQGYGYGYMFYGCTNLTNVPKLPTTTFGATAAYSEMFRGCTNLTVAPELLATTLRGNCYYGMFFGTKVNYVKMLGLSIPTQALTNWLSNVPDVSTSIFVKNIDATWTDTGVSGVPANWTIIYYDPALDKYYTDQTRATECDDHGNII